MEIRRDLSLRISVRTVKLPRSFCWKNKIESLQTFGRFGFPKWRDLIIFCFFSTESLVVALSHCEKERERNLGKFLKTDAISSERITGRDLSPFETAPRTLEFFVSTELQKLAAAYMYILGSFFTRLSTHHPSTWSRLLFLHRSSPPRERRHAEWILNETN